MGFSKALSTNYIQMKNAPYQRTAHYPSDILRGTISIPGELLLSRARFRFLMAPQNYFHFCTFTNCIKLGKVTEYYN